MTRRAPLVIAGTLAGVAGVLAFPTHRVHLVVPGSTAAGSTGAAGATGGSGATPTTAAPAGGSSSASGSATEATRRATGTDTPYPYGDLAVQVTVQGGKITDLSVARLQDTDGRSAAIDQQAIPLLRQQVLAAQSTNIDGVSGATYTSQAYVDSVQSALDRLGVR